MLEENKIVELTEEELEKVNGGGFWVGGIEYQNSTCQVKVRCPNCGSNEHTNSYSDEPGNYNNWQHGAYLCTSCNHFWHF